MSRRRGNSGNPITLFSFQDIICSISGIMILVALLLALEVVNRKTSVPPGGPPAIPSLGPDPEKLKLDIARQQREIKNLEEQQGRALTKLKEVAQNDPTMMEDNAAKETETNRGLTADANKWQTLVAARKNELEGIEKDNKKLEEEKERLDALVAYLQANPRVRFVPATDLRKTPILVQCSEKSIATCIMREPNEVKSFDGAGDDRAFVQAFIEWSRSRNTTSEAFYVLVKPSSAFYVGAIVGSLLMSGFDVGYEPFEEEKTAVVRQEGSL